jgi:probable rRNA maturation factor
MSLVVQVNLEAPPAGMVARSLGALLERAAQAALRDAGFRDATLSVTLLDDAGITALNRQYLDRDGPTDVIAFALHEAGEPPLGDVYVDVDQAATQAAAYAVPLEQELVRLVVHGTLHVLGHDHPEGPERDSSSMWALQERLVREVADG